MYWPVLAAIALAVGYYQASPFATWFAASTRPLLHFADAIERPTDVPTSGVAASAGTLVGSSRWREGGRPRDPRKATSWQRHPDRRR